MIPCPVVSLFSSHIGNAILHWGLGSNPTAIGWTWRIVRFWIDLCSRRECQLSGDHDCLFCLETAFNHYRIALLTLTRFNLPQIDCVIRLHHKNKWATLANLYRLRWH